MKRITVIFTFLLLLLVPAGVTLAASAYDKVIEEDETSNGEVTLFGENLEVAAGGKINGDVVLMGGNAILDGTINGDLVIFGGDLTVSDTAVITGDCILFGGRMIGAEDSTISCDNMGEFQLVLPNALDNLRLPRWPMMPEVPAPPHQVDPPTMPQYRSSFWADLGAVISRTLILGVLAFIAGALLPNQLERVSLAVRKQPVVTATVGMLTAAAGISLIALLAAVSGLLILLFCLGLLGFPVVFFLAVLLAAAILFGWVAIGYLLGRRLAKRFGFSNRTAAVNAALGTAVLTLALGLVGLLPFFLGGFMGFLLTWLVAAIGLGATALTQFGTRTYPAGAGSGSSDKVTSVLETLPDEDD